MHFLKQYFKEIKRKIAETKRMRPFEADKTSKQ